MRNSLPLPMTDEKLSGHKIPLIFRAARKEMMKAVFTFAILIALHLVMTRSACATIIYEPYAVTTSAGRGNNTATVDGPPDVAEFHQPNGLAVDKQGNVYVAELWGHTIRKITPDGTASTFAGKAGEAGSADGTGGEARFEFPAGVAFGPDGFIYVADFYNYTIRKISRQAVVTTFAGAAGMAGFVNGVGSDARFSNPSGLGLDRAGNVYVADSFNYAIRKISPDGAVTTFAGGTRGSKNGKGTEAQFDYPTDLAVDRLGNIYVAENGNNQDVRKINPDGVVTTIATNLYIYGIAVDRNLNVFAALGDRISLITDQVTLFAGGRYGSNDGAGAEAEFGYAQRIGVDRQNNLYVSDTNGFYIETPNNIIRKVTPEAVVTTLSGVADEGSRDGLGTTARFFWPRGIVSDAGGTLYIADTQNSTIRKMTPDGTVTTIAGKVQTPGYVDGGAFDARFNNPWAVALDATGNLFIADRDNNVVRKLTPAGEVSTVAGGYNFSSPSGVAADALGNIYVAATNNQTIDQITLPEDVIVLAGSPGHKGNQDGTGRGARFRDPAGLALDSNGNIYVADYDNDNIRKVTPNGVVTTLAGTSRHGSNDGMGTEASFINPSAVAVDAAGNVYVADYGNQTLRKITPSGSTTTLAGTPGSGGWIDATGSEARFALPYGIAVDAAGNLYVADTYNHSIRRGAPAQ
jgi:sugar lactone lactonase YvrE